MLLKALEKGVREIELDDCMTRWKLFDVTSHGMYGYFSSSAYSHSNLLRSQNFTSLFNNVAVHTFCCQTSKNITNSDGLDSTILLGHG